MGGHTGQWPIKGRQLIALTCVWSRPWWSCGVPVTTCQSCSLPPRCSHGHSLALCPLPPAVSLSIIKSKPAKQI